MDERRPGEWVLVIDFGQPLSGVRVDERTGKIKIPWAGQVSMWKAAQQFQLGFEGPPRVLSGEVTSDG